MDYVTKQLQEGRHVIGLYLDTKKAFDSVNHNILLGKMRKCGLRGNCHDLVRDYITNRTQAVRMNDSLSSYSSTECGVPQGSVLGPLLFLIFLNDFNSISSKLEVITFADDASIFMSNSDMATLESQMNKELVKINTWFECNMLKLNLQKTGFQLFTKSKRHVDPKLEICGVPIDKLQEVKFLGVLVDPDLTFKPHIHKLSVKLAQLSGVIGSVKHLLSISQLVLIYNALVLPHLTYCSLIWGLNYHTRLHRLLVLQKRMVRHILGLNYRDSVTHRFGELKILTVFSIMKYRAIIFAHKHLNNALPRALRNLLEIRDPVVDTRDSSTFIIPFTRSNYRKNTVRFFVPKIWNELGQNCDLSQGVTISTIKKRIKKVFV